MNLSPLFLSIQLAALTTVILLLIAIPISSWLYYSKSRWKPIVESIISLPLILPPTVLGFYLLIAFSPNSWLGSTLAFFDIQLVFSFPGLVIASVIYSLPFMVQPISSGLQNLPRNLMELSFSLGKSKFQTLLKVLLPNMKPNIYTGIILSFAHTIGEFGVVLMIGGNIPDETRVISIAIYDEVEKLNYSLANTYSMILIAFALTILIVLNLLNRRNATKNLF